MKIGHFTKSEDGIFEGRIQTLTLTADLRFEPVAEKTNENQPDLRIIDVNTDQETGGGWLKKTQDEKPYISSEIDEPVFPAPIYPALMRDDTGEYSLYWNRPKKRNGSTDKPAMDEL